MNTKRTLTVAIAAAAAATAVVAGAGTASAASGTAFCYSNNTRSSTDRMVVNYNTTPDADPGDLEVNFWNLNASYFYEQLVNGSWRVTSPTAQIQKSLLADNPSKGLVCTLVDYNFVFEG